MANQWTKLQCAWCKVELDRPRQTRYATGSRTASVRVVAHGNLAFGCCYCYTKDRYGKEYADKCYPPSA